MLKVENEKEYIEELKKENLRLKKLLEDSLKENEELKKKLESKHNIRNAGRKNKFNVQEIESMKKYRIQGMKLKEIADMFNCSIGLVHKLINEK